MYKFPENAVEEECRNLIIESAEDFVTVFDDELHCVILGVHVAHLSFEAGVAHNGGCKDDSEVLGGHLDWVSGELAAQDGERHTKFSLSRKATRARWKIRNSRQSRCFGGSILKVLLR